MVMSRPFMRAGREQFGVDRNDPNLALYLPLWYPGMQRTAPSLDISGHVSTPTGVTWGSQGAIFDGVDDKVSVAHSTQHNFGTSTDFTWIVWAKMTDTTAVQALISKQDAGSGVGIIVSISVSGGNRRLWSRLRQDASNYYYFENTTQLVNNTWYHIAVRRISGALTYVINGVLDANTGVGTAGLGAASDGDTTQPVRFGLKGDDSQDLAGTIGEGLIYRRGLSVAECLQQKQSTQWRYV